jgi:hypothetical protein
LNPEDVFGDLKKAHYEKRRVRVSRSEVDGRIRWVIEIEDRPLLTEFGAKLRGFLDETESKVEEEDGDWREEWR